MAWNTPPTYVAGDVLTASGMNTYVRDNFNYLLSGWSPAFVSRNNGANYTTTSTTFTDVDATNVKASITIAGTKALIWTFCHMTCTGTGDGSELDIIVNSTTRLGNSTHGLFRGQQGGILTVSLPAVATGLTPGANDFKLQYRCITSGTTTIFANPAATVGSGGTYVTMVAWGI